MNGNAYAVSRGRAYNETNFVSVLWSGASPLPVEFLSFTGTVSGKDVRLKWTTASEKENDHFTLFRSSDGGNFTELTHVKGCGTCNARHEYGYTDKQVPAGLYYYQLQQTDVDGNTSGSMYVSVRIDAAAELPSCTVFPNPNDGYFFIGTKGFTDTELLITVFDVNGRRVYSTELLPGTGNRNEQLVDLSGLESGTYLLEVKGAQSVSRTKLIRN